MNLIQKEYKSPICLYCSDNKDWYSNECQSNICIGKIENEKSITDNDCDINLFCHSSLCSPLAKSDEKVSYKRNIGMCINLILH